MSLSYRPEIDGLRALAVTCVVLFHAKVPGFENGFVGVDIFFVISGFLITSIIAREQADGGFSYGRFVMRRVRRILPALVLVMLACIPFAWWLMLPDPLENFGQSLVATTLLSNNILLWLTHGYWDLNSDFKPLLHTWSLGVEEQFYILYPFVLVLALRMPFRACLALLAGLALLSFGLMVRALHDDPAAAFYLLHFRAWQLLIGAIAGLLAVRSVTADSPILAGLGLAMVLTALAPWPGLPVAMTLSIATLGAALFLLWARTDSKVTWVLTRRPVIFVGLVSYSFYLWHQPIFAFLRVAFFVPPGPTALGMGIALAFGLAILSWRFVETPFRSEARTRAWALWACVGGGIAMTVTAGLIFHLTNGLPQRMGDLAKRDAAGMLISYNERIRKLLPSHIPTDAGDKPVVMIAGDSFARDVANVLLEADLGNDVILLYREDLSVCVSGWSAEDRAQVETLDILLFARDEFSIACIEESLAATKMLNLPLFIGGTKHFGSNINPLVRLAPADRGTVRLAVPDHVRSLNETLKARLGPVYLDYFAILSEDDGRTVRAADDNGVLLTTDRVHFSKAGAAYVAERLSILFPELLTLAGDNHTHDAGR